MKLVIDISEDTYKKILMCINGINITVEARSAIRYGTPLEEELKKIKAEIIGSCNNIAEEVSDLSYTRKIYVYEQLSEIKGAIDNHISELKGENK